MNIPNFIDTKIVDENGKLTNEFRQFFSQLIDQLQYNLSDEGYIIPSQNTVNINKLNASNVDNILLIDNDTNELKIKIGGIFRTVQLI